MLDAPEWTDAQYDARMNELKALEAAHPELVTPDSPTQRVGGKPKEGFVKVAHSRPMLSLDNAYNEAELRAWAERVQGGLAVGESPRYVCELKLDGLSLALQYEAGSGGAAVLQVRRHARRWQHRRGRDDERADDPQRSAAGERRRS